LSAVELIDGPDSGRSLLAVASAALVEADFCESLLME
jgi:hypothetical protein